MRRKKKARWEFIHGRGGRLASLPPYPRPIAKEIEEMYEYGAPHCLYHPDDPLLCDTGASQPNAVDGFMVGMAPPPHVCTHRILFDLNVDVALYEGTFLNVRRTGGATCAEREIARRRSRE